MKQAKKQVADKMEYGYLKRKKNLLLAQLSGIVAAGLAVFILGLLLNKWEVTNIFTVIAMLFVIPAARYLTVWVLLLPYQSSDSVQYDEVKKRVQGHGLLLADLVFTSAERAMHLNYMVLAGAQAYCYVEKDGKKQSEDAQKKRKKRISATEEYLNKHFANQGLTMKAKIFEEYPAFLKAISSHELREGEWEEQEKVRDSMKYFMV